MPTEQPFPRLIFACDEVAEMLDKTGADNERKKLLAQIENRLSTIARQGRAFGIHLILATQRPDANVPPGQIKNNMDFRVCGRAGNVLPQIILDNTSAAEQISKDAQGRFITGDGTVFQGYLFDEEQIWRGDTMPRRKKPNDYGTGIPYHEVEALARVLLPEIQAFFESEDGQREYAEWKAKQQAEQENKV